MKLHLISIILFLVPLAIADQQAPATAKFRFRNGYVISEVYSDPYLLKFEQTDGWKEDHYLLVFTIQNKVTERTEESITIKLEKAREDNLTFAIDTFVSENSTDTDICRQRASANLRSLIVHCRNNVILRDLTGEEKRQLEKFEEEHKKNKNLFKVTYEDGQMRTQFVKIAWFILTQETWPNHHYFNLRTNENSVSYRARNMDVWGLLNGKSFVIDGLYDGREGDCYRTDHPNVRPHCCVGPIQLRKLN